MLSCNPEFVVEDAEDNQQCFLVDPKVFKIQTGCQGHALVEGEKKLLQEIREGIALLLKSLKEVENLGPKRIAKGLEEWNEENGLLIHQGRVVVPDNPDLQRRILELHHDAPTAGHPGRWKTFELVSRNYWWAGLSTFVKNYIDACDLCLCTKTFPSKPSGPLMPNAVPEGPWQVITADLITGLPRSEGFDAIAVVVDRFTKQVHLSPTKGTLTAEGLADLYI